MTKPLFLGNNLEMHRRPVWRGWPSVGLSLLLLLFFLKTIAQETAQPSQYRLLWEMDSEATHFTTDKLRNVYYVSKNNDVVKLQPDGSEQFRYASRTLGTPGHIDATNPFQLLLYYPGHQTLVTLDRTMNPAGQYNLFGLGLFGLDAVGMAGDGNLWLYDSAIFRLKKITTDGHTLLQSADLSLDLNKAIRPNFLLEKDQLVYLNDPAEGILVFDVFGKYLKTLPLKGLDGFQIAGDELLFFQSGQLQSFHLLTLLQSGLRLPAGISPGDQLRVEKDRLYVLGIGKFRAYGF